MRHILDYIKKNKFLLLLIIPGLLLHLLVIFPSGTFYCFTKACGINFWGVHGHDGIWHLAIANTSFNKFPFIAPTFSGENLYGYNYFLDFIIFLLSKIGIPAIFTYFKLLPVIWFFIFTWLLIILGRKIKDSPIFVGLFLFFSYFAGSFSFLLTLLHDKTTNGSSTLLPLPVMHEMSNLPYSFSLLPFLGILILIKNKKIDLKTIILFGVFVFFSLGLKFYGGIISLFLVLIYILISTITKRFRDFILFNLIIGAFVVVSILLFYDPFSAIKSGFPFGWAPFALVHPITEEPNQFYLQSMTDARYYLVEHGIGPRLILIESINLFLFLFFYLGTRIFGLFYLPVLLLKKKLERFDFAIMLTIFFSTLLTVLLVQKAEWWNTIQFFFYAIFLSTIYLTKLTYDLMSNKKIFGLIAFVIILLSIPPSIDLIRLFAVTPGAAYVPKYELDALNYLKKQPEGIVFTPLYNKEWKNYQNPNTLYRYEDTAYIPAFTGKPVYLSDVLQLRLTGVNFEKRLEKVKNLDCSILNEVNYIYEIRELPDSDKIAIKCKDKRVKKIFNGDKVMIYSVK